MFDFDKISFNLSYSAILFVVGIIIVLLYSYYIYRYTLPPVALSKRILLASLRGSALILLLFIFFEPILSTTKKEISEPAHLIFIDNSKSMTIDDGTDREKTVINISETLFDKLRTSNAELFLFGNRVEALDKDSLFQLDFSHSATNFSKIFNSVDPGKLNIASITVISDGVITDGSTPIFLARQKAVPVFTIGIGDSSRRNDVEVRSVLYNELIYAETPTTIMGTVTNRGFGGHNVVVSLYEDDILLGQKNMILDVNGTNNIYFDYTPKTSGEKKLTITVSGLKEEFTLANNKKIFYVNVLSNKIKVLLISGSPSADMTFIKNSLLTDNNLSVSTLTQFRNNQFIESNHVNKIDSADIIFFIGFPTKETSSEAVNLISKKISDQNTPFFISLTSDVDVTKLTGFQQQLPFTASQIDNIYQQVQPEIQINENNNPIIKNNATNPVNAWNNLPPVLQPRANINVKPESKIISGIRIDNVARQIPLLLTRSLGRNRSIAILAKDIWRWKLQTANRNSDLFDSFINNSVRWLNVSDEFKKVKINPVKKIFASGEDIEFSARVFDDAMNPVANSDVTVTVSNQQERFELNLNSVGSGLYEGRLKLINPGDYVFSGEARLNGNIYGEDSGIFNIGEVDIEMLNPGMDYDFLNLLAEETGGKYFQPNQTDELINELNNLSARAIKEKFVTSDIKLWSSEWLLLITIIVFGIEWFIRKRAGML